MEKKKQKQINPLRLLWIYVFAPLGAVSSLSTLAERIIAWQGFALALINFYKAIVRPPFRFFAQLAGFAVPEWLQDYLVFGNILILAIRMTELQEKEAWIRRHSFSLTWKGVADYVWIVMLWPIYIFDCARNFVRRRQLLKREDVDWDFKKRLRTATLELELQYNIGTVRYDRQVFRWIGAVLCAFVLLAVVNEVGRRF